MDRRTFSLFVVVVVVVVVVVIFPNNLIDHLKSNSERVGINSFKVGLHN